MSSADVLTASASRLASVVTLTPEGILSHSHAASDSFTNGVTTKTDHRAAATMSAK